MAETTEMADNAASMQLETLLPFRVYARVRGVARIVAETRAGSFGVLPHRLDCTASLVPGILIYETAAGAEVCVAVDEGVLVKTGLDVVVSVRRAIGGTDLAGLRAAVEREFVAANRDAASLRVVMAKLETSFVRRLAGLRHD
jgi:F-type H+-transporting ATPase subunit epsilon